MRKLLRSLIFRSLVALVMVLSGKITVKAEQYWCAHERLDGHRVVFVTNDQGTASVLYIENGKPNYWPRQEQVLVPLHPNDPNDLRAYWAWKVEGIMFGHCRGEVDVTWAPSQLPPTEVPLPETGTHP